MTRDGGVEDGGLITLATRRHDPHKLSKNKMMGHSERYIDVPYIHHSKLEGRKSETFEVMYGNKPPLDKNQDICQAML